METSQLIPTNLPSVSKKRIVERVMRETRRIRVHVNKYSIGIWKIQENRVDSKTKLCYNGGSNSKKQERFYGY